MSDSLPPIKRRERDAVLQSLQAGLVPRQGLHLIQVGRKAEVTAMLGDLDRIADGGSSFRLVVGRFGSGKSFFLNLVRNVAFQKNIVVAQADFSMERRLYATGGEARNLYSELMRNLATKTQPEGGALGSVMAAWVSRIQHEILSAGGTEAQVEARLAADLADLQTLVGGFEFAEVARLYYRATRLPEGDGEARKAAALRWMRGEFPTKTEAREALGVRRIIDDAGFYDSLKLMAAFVRKAGFAGLLVNLDEMVVLSHRLPNSRARQANYEALLTLLNDCLQGNVAGLGFVFAGTDECLEDKRRGLFSYDALRSRLAENELAQKRGLVDLSGPVLRLQPLTPEDLFVLLKNVAHVHAWGDPARRLVGDDAIEALLRKASETLGADYFRTPRDIIRSFVGLLNLLDQNPGATWQSLLESAPAAKKEDAEKSGNPAAAAPAVLQKTPAPASTEEELALGAPAAEEEGDGDLASFKL